MNTPWKRWLAAAALGLSGVAAQAGNVQWSIGINLPPIGTVISSGPAYPYPAAVPAYGYDPYGTGYAPPAAVYAPAPIYHAPAPIVYRPAPVYYAPPRAFYRPAPHYHPRPAVIDHHWGPPRGHWDHRGGPRADPRWDRTPEPRGGYIGPRDGRGDRGGGMPVPRDERRWRPGPG